MGPPPRSLAAEAHGCFMVRVRHGPNRIQGCGARDAPDSGLPSDQSKHASTIGKQSDAIKLDTDIPIQGCVKTPRSFHTLVVLVCFRGLRSIRSRKIAKNFRLRDRSPFFHDFLHSLGRFDPFTKPSANGRYLRTPDGWSRRLADVADPNPGRLKRAGSAPTKVVSGKTDVRAKAAVPCERDIGFTARKRASIRALMTTAKGRRRPSKDPVRSTAPVGSEVIQNPALIRDS